MKIKGSILINQSRDIVVRLFANPNYLKEYQDGFIKKDLIEGQEGEAGAVSMMYYQHGKHKMELQETITQNKLPDTFEASYYHEHMDNTMKCTFIAVDEQTTRYEYEYEYTRINWIMPKLIAIFFPSMYRKPAEKWLKQFKEFVEKE